MKPNFQSMTIQELKKYVLEHRDDQEAFCRLVDRLDAQSGSPLYTARDIDRFPELLREHQQSQQH